MHVLRIDNRSPFRNAVGVGGLGTGVFFALDGDHTLARNESRPGRLLEARDYCKLHVVLDYIARLLGARPSHSAFQVLPVGKLGDDPAGGHVLEEMERVGMNARFVKKVKGKPTLFSVCFQYPDGTGGNITASNSAAADLSESELAEVAEFLNMHGRGTIALSLPEVPLPVRGGFLKLATTSGAFRAASFVDTEISAAREQGLLQKLDLLALNESEAEMLTGTRFCLSNPKRFIEDCWLLAKRTYPDLKIIVTVGKYGAYAFAEGCVGFCRAPIVPVVSTAGAGDALLAGVLSGLAAGLPFLDAQPDRQGLSDGVLATALDLGVLLASYKVSSPHTIHPGVSIDSLLEFANDVRVKFAPEVRRKVVDLPYSPLAPSTY